MKRHILAISLCILFGSFANAQNKKLQSSKYKFTLIPSVGILEGSADKTFGQIQVVGGLQKNTCFAGIGAGIDYYGDKRSVPLFVDLKKNFKTGNKTPFIYADAGYNFSWLRENEKVVNQFSGTNDYKQKGGLFYEAGLGYKFILKNKLALGFSAGYSCKQSKEIYTPFIWIDFPPFPNPNPSPQNPETYEYKFNRVSLKLNCWF